MSSISALYTSAIESGGCLENFDQESNVLFDRLANHLGTLGNVVTADIHGKTFVFQLFLDGLYFHVLKTVRTHQRNGVHQTRKFVGGEKVLLDWRLGFFTRATR